MRSGGANEQRELVFYGSSPMNYVVFRPVHRRLLRDSRLRVWLTGKCMESKDPRRLYHEFDVPRDMVIGMLRARLKRFDMYLVARWRVALPRVPVKVHFFHGVSFKNYAVSGHAREFDRLFIVGEYHRRRLIKEGILEENDPRIAMIGMPKTDCLVDGSLNRERVLTSMGLNPHLKTILYAPTWSEASSLFTLGEEIMRTVSRRPMNFLVKLHDSAYDPKRSSVDWRARLAPFENERAKLVRDWDVCPYLYASDILISDASSVSSEFTLLDRPIIFIDVPELMQRWEKADLETWGQKTGWVARTAGELDGCIDAALAEPMKHSEIRRAAAADLFYKPGTATDRAVAEIYRLLGLEPPEAEKRG